MSQYTLFRTKERQEEWKKDSIPRGQYLVASRRGWTYSGFVVDVSSFVNEQLSDIRVAVVRRYVQRCEATLNGKNTDNKEVNKNVKQSSNMGEFF